MDKDLLEQSIIEQCLDPDSLLILIRENRFDDEKYRKLYDTLVDYRRVISRETMMNRLVAGCLWTLEIVFSNAIAYHDRQPEKSEIAGKTTHAFSEVFDLINDIFFAEN
jgi:hypothetical protein